MGHEKFTQLLKNLIAPLREFIYPPTCFSCHKHLEHHALIICSDCWNSFTEVHPEDAVWIKHKQNLLKEGYIDDLFSVFLFQREGKFQEIIHLMKYQALKSIAIKLGQEIGTRIKKNSWTNHPDYLIPVPLHRHRMRERGYNQSDLLCRGIMKITNIPCLEQLLIRKKYTLSQTTLTPEERRKNVENAFEINQKFAELIKGKTLILVDDIITTGSTANACAKHLRYNGAGSIYAVSAGLAE